MSGDLTHVQCQMLTNEFVDKLKSLSISQSASTYGDGIEQLHNQLKSSIPNGLSGNTPFAFTIIDNLYRIVPILDTILSNDDDDNNNDFRQANNFLVTLGNAFEGICLFEIMSEIKDYSRIQIIFQHYIVLLKETYFKDNNKYDNLTNCLLPIVGLSSIFIPVNEDKIPPHLFTYLLTFTKQYWQCQHREKMVKNILMSMKAFCKKPSLVPMIIRSEWPHACVQWLGIINTREGSRPAYMIEYFISLIVQKLARHTIGVQILNQLNCLKALTQYGEQMHKDHTEEEQKCLQFLQCMIYALLMEANDIKQLSLCTDGQMCEVFKQLTSYTIEASHSDFFFYKCFHISEMLSVLSKLFVNDDILTKCINSNNEFFDCLCQLIIHFTTTNGDTKRTHQTVDDETLLILTNLSWSISFHQCYHEKFQTNSMLMHTLSNLAASASLFTNTQTKSIPRDLCSLKKAAEGILWNLKSSSSRPVTAIANEEQPLAMISYSHSDSTFCRELVERLSVHVPVWVDYKQAHDAVAHSDDLWEEIARAMEMATIIVLIVSKEYYDSKSCRQELSYASDTLKKRIVPIYAPNQQYRASGWLGIRIAGQKYIHFGRKLFTDAIKELASIVVTDQKPVRRSSSPPPPPPPVRRLSSPPPSRRSSSPPPVKHSSSIFAPIKIKEEEENELFKIEDWTAKDVRQWFDDNHINNNLITLYGKQFLTSTALIIYARHLKLFYRNEYIRIFTKYYNLFNGEALDTFDFITFVDALYRLRTEHDPNCDTEDSYEKLNDQQLSCEKKVPDEGMTWL